MDFANVNLVQEFRRQLMSGYQVTSAEATIEQMHSALGNVVMRLTAEQWYVSRHARDHIRRAYYFSAEYLVGRMVFNNLYSLGMLEQMRESFRKAGIEVSEVCMGGGTTNSELFMQIHADISNVIVNVPENPQSCTLGSAILAAVGAGLYKDYDEAVANMVRYTKRIYPNAENHAKYKKIFAQYQKAYETIGPWMRETTAICKK